METQASGFWARAWWGEERLWKVWWLLGFPLSLASNSFNTAAIYHLIGNPLIFLGGWAVLLMAYFTWLAIAWRCAPNVKNQAWKYIARIVIVLGASRALNELFRIFQSGGSHI
jgi:hypothetical protein